MLKDEIKAKLTDAGINFDEDMKKEELLQLMEDSNIQDSEPNTTSEEVVQVGNTQKKYVVVHDFKDLKDNNTIYIAGDIYPRRVDAVVDEERIKELSSTKNKMNKVLIKEQE